MWSLVLDQAIRFSRVKFIKNHFVKPSANWGFPMTQFNVRSFFGQMLLKVMSLSRRKQRSQSCGFIHWWGKHARSTFTRVFILHILFTKKIWTLQVTTWRFWRNPIVFIPTGDASCLRAASNQLPQDRWREERLVLWNIARRGARLHPRRSHSTPLVFPHKVDPLYTSCKFEITPCKRVKSQPLLPIYVQRNPWLIFLGVDLRLI